MAKKITDFDFELWAEQNTQLSQDLGVRPQKYVSRFAEEMADWDSFRNWDTASLSGPVRKVSVEEYLRGRK